jgi:hypothetical protein
MRSGGSANLSDARHAGQPGRHSVRLRGTTPGIAVVAVTPRGATVAAAPTRAAATVVVAAATLPAVAGSTQADRDRCIRQRVRSAGGTLKFRSSRAPTSRSTAGSASSCDGRLRPRGVTTTSPEQYDSPRQQLARRFRRNSKEGGLKPPSLLLVMEPLLLRRLTA